MKPFYSTVKPPCNNACWLAGLLIATLVPLAGCGPVSSKSSGSGLFRGNNTFASNQRQLAPGFSGGFGQSIFGSARGAAFETAANANSAVGGFQLPRLPGTGFGNNQANTNATALANANNQSALNADRFNQRIQALDSDNQLLNTELASLRQRLQLSNDYSQTLKTQLADSARQAQQFGGQNQAASQQLLAAQQRIQQLERQAQLAAETAARAPDQSRFANASFGSNSPTQLPSAASLGANNTLRQRINAVNIPGAQPRLDGDVIRIEFQSDRVFVPGSYQIQPATLPALQATVGTIRQNFPRQIVGIEAHWDGTPLNPATTTHHQLTATQALAVFDRLVSLGVPRSQLFTMALGSNRPRYDQNASGNPSANRRIELVIYPETFDGS